MTKYVMNVLKIQTLIYISAFGYFYEFRPMHARSYNQQ